MTLAEVLKLADTDQFGDWLTRPELEELRALLALRERVEREVRDCEEAGLDSVPLGIVKRILNPPKKEGP